MDYISLMGHIFLGALLCPLDLSPNLAAWWISGGAL